MLDLGSQQDLLTVLLIDDDLVSREVMATVLTTSGYAVHTAGDGEASLALLDGECVPGLILVDAQMPGLSGKQLIEELRSRSRACILVISASTAPSEMVAAADGFLLKPLTGEGLQKLLHAHPPKHPPASPPHFDVPVPQSADTVVSPETLARLREMMPASAVRQIYAAIVADLNRRIGALEVAIAKGDAAEVRRIGHAIKGGCGMGGAQQAAHLGAMIESGILESRGNQLDNNSSVIGDLRTAARNLESMLEAGFPA
jgi:DNA-binding response OmpR family regulator